MTDEFQCVISALTQMLIAAGAKVSRQLFQAMLTNYENYSLPVGSSPPTPFFWFEWPFQPYGYTDGQYEPGRLHLSRTLRIKTRFLDVVRQAAPPRASSWSATWPWNACASDLILLSHLVEDVPFVPFIHYQQPPQPPVPFNHPLSPQSITEFLDT